MLKAQTRSELCISHPLIPGPDDHSLLCGLPVHRTVCILLVINKSVLLTTLAIAVQHICMAKALIQEHELENIHLSAESSATAKIKEVCSPALNFGPFLTRPTGQPE